MNGFAIFILLVIVMSALFQLLVEVLNLLNLKPDLPEAFQGLYDAQTYRKSQSYLRDNTRLGLVKTVLLTPLLLVFMFLGGFNWVDSLARQWVETPVLTGLVFCGILSAILWVISLPLSIIHTFVIEEKYGFNKTTVPTFILDTLKAILLATVIGGIALAGIFWFFETTGALAWLYAWLGLTLFQLVISYVAPVLFIPLFNKLTPLSESELKSSIEAYAAKQNFKIQGIFTMDGSKRSTKANAFFTGLGKYKRVVLFDTLIEKHTPEELVAVVAHEIGHYKKKHIFKQLILSVASSGVMFYLLSLFLNNPALFEAFKMDHLSVYASLVFFSFLYIPISQFLSLFSNYLSRKYEFEADTFSAMTYPIKGALIKGLKRLSVDSLSNLTPHALKVFVDYTHPPVLQRIEHLKKIESS